jgi:hypothetical protein
MEGDAEGDKVSVSGRSRVKKDGGQGKRELNGFSPEDAQEDGPEEKNVDGGVTVIVTGSTKDNFPNTHPTPTSHALSSIVERPRGAKSKGELPGDGPSHDPLPNATQKTYKDVSKAINFQWTKVTALTLSVKLILADFEPQEYYNAADVAVALDEMTESVSSYLIKSSSNNFSVQQKDDTYLQLIDTFS